MNHPLANFVKRFLAHYLPVQRGLSINTIKSYRDTIKLLLRYAADTLRRGADNLTVEDVSEKVVLGFLDQVERVRDCTASTRNARLAAIRSLFAFIAREEPILLQQCSVIRTIPLKRTRHKTVAYLEEREMQAVLDAIGPNSRMGTRDKALLLLFYNTGARASEVVQISLRDLQLMDSPHVRLHGKGNKDRSCPLWPETARALKAYLEERDLKAQATERLFLNAAGDPITRFGLRYVTRKYGALAQEAFTTSNPVNPHTIRHTTAMHLLRAGNDINMVSYWLGHAQSSTTHVYVEIDMAMKREMIDKAGAPTSRRKSRWREPRVLQWLDALTNPSELCAVGDAAYGRK